MQTTPKLKAFQGDPQLKKDLVAEIRAHQKADEIRQGTYGKTEGGKFIACAVGCAIKSYNDRRGTNFGTDDHQVYEDQLGIPRVLAHLEDRIFEGLQTKDALKFPLAFMKAIPVGADLSLVHARFIVWLLTDQEDGVIRFAFDDGKKAIQQVSDLWQRIIDGGAVTDEEWESAEAEAAAAAAAAEAAAWAEAAAEAAAWAARSAEAAAEAAAAAARSAAAWAARSAYKRMSLKLVELLKEAPVVEDK